ncbi:MAG: hypothetical protein KFB93_05020 [Simkaniaceae bacterium]|nr:MAG: hypothetical protein KFB93_05020 [Simkaniaceae bacterium]
MEQVRVALHNHASLPIQQGLGTLDMHPVQIISNNPVTGGVSSYGTIAKIFAIVVIIFIAIPLIKVFKHIYSRFQTHYDTMKDIRANLAENRLQAIQKMLPKTDLVPEDLHINRTEYLTLLQKGHTLEGIEATVDRLLRGEEVEGLDLEFYAIAKGQMRFNAEYRSEYRWILQLAKEANVDINEIEQLADRAKGHRNLERFLLKDGTLGTDSSAPAFKAGMELVRFRIGLIYNDPIIEEFNAIKRAIEEAPKEGLEGYLQKEVRERLDRLQQCASYRLLLKVEGRHNSVVRNIQNLSLAVRLDSHGIEQLHFLGASYLKVIKEERGDVPGEKQATYLADALDDVIGKHHWSYKIESFVDKLLVWVRYPEKTSMAARSHSPDTALDYNSYQVGNHDMAYGDYSLGGHQMRAIHGPTPTSDHLLQAQLEAQREVGGIHLQHNLEHPAFSSGDLVRTQYLMSVERDYPETFRLMSTPLDGPGWSLKGKAGEYFMDYDSVEGFLLKYGTFAFNNRYENPAQSFAELEGASHRMMEGRGDNGFYVGPEVMSDEQFRLAFAYASEAFSHVDPKTEHERKRLTKALQVGVQGFLAVGAMIKTLKDAYPDVEDEEIQETFLKASFGQACKLDIDRGVVLNVMTRIYFQMAAGKDLNEDDISEIIGTVIGRAELVSGRTIIADRYQPLSDALRLVGGNQENVRRALQNYIRKGFDIDPEALDYKSSS